VKIDALEWLIFNPEQRAEAMFQANAMMRIFLGKNLHPVLKSRQK
jgi:Nuclear pore protein 84 / 107